MKITLYEHPLKSVAPTVHDTDNLPLWLLAHYGEAPDFRIQIFKGQPSGDTEITQDLKAILSCADDVVILQSPSDGGLIAYVIISLVFAVAAYALTPKPKMPDNVNRSQQSPNNALSDRSNQVRMYQRIEDIYGQVKSIPSLMMQPYSKYINHIKYEYGYYCVGRGYYNLTEVRDGESLVSDIAGAAASVYDPFKSPNSGHAPVQQIGGAINDNVYVVERSIEVDGITLRAENEVNLAASGNFRFYLSSGENGLEQLAKNPNFNTVLTVGNSFTITMSDIVVNTYGGTLDENGDPIITGSVTVNYSGTYTISFVGNGFVKFTANNWTTEIESAPASVSSGSYTPVDTNWITLPDPERTEVWCNVAASNGMYRDSGGKSTTGVNFSIYVEQLDVNLDPTGNVQTTNSSLSGFVSDERAVTVQITTGWTGPCRVKAMRTSSFDYTFAGTIQDEIKWLDLYSVAPVSKSNFGNVTTIHTVTKATARATSVKSRQLNCLAYRKIPTYNGSVFSGAFSSTGALASGSIYPTSKIVDIIGAISSDPLIGNQDMVNEVDMPQIYATQQLLDAWNANCGQFNYTFDSDNTSFEESLITVANAAFCIAYRQNGKIRLSLDRAQSVSSAVFTHRNKKPNAETISRSFATSSDYDAIELTYVDPDTNQSESIKLPALGAYNKVKKLEIAGIRNFAQAWLRANREYKKLIGQRLSIDTTTTLDARSLLPNTRVDIVDNTKFNSYDGEVVAQNGLELTLSRTIEFTPSQPHSIVLMKRDGTIQSIPVTAGSAANRVVLQYLPSEAIVTQYSEDGIRTIYSFAADSDRGAMAWMIQSLDLSDPQYVNIKAINYDASYYSADYLAIPDKDSIIN